jgi:hypothetical protein
MLMLSKTGIGELLRDVPRAKKRRKGADGLRAMLARSGIAEQTSRRWQLLAQYPEADLIAKQIGVNQNYVAEMRREVSATTNLPDKVTGKDGKQYPATS